MTQRFFVALGLMLWAIIAQAQTPLTTILTMDDRLNAMTLEQKVAQLFVATFHGAPPNEPIKAMLRQWQVGAVVLLPSNLGTPQQITSVTNTLQQIVIEAGGVPLFIGVDQEGGLIAHLKDGFTEFPVPQLLTASNDPVLAFTVGEAMGREMRAVGINLNLAPVADLNTNPRNPIIGRRSFGTDPHQVGRMVASVIEGLQSVGVMATAKHFPGHGDTETDSHVTLPVLYHDMTRLNEIELVPFRYAQESGVGAMMVAHISYPLVDGVENRAASLSPMIINGVLREGMGYTGIIMTDAMDMDAIDTRYTPAERALLAIEAGNDMLILGAHISPDAQSQAIQAVVNAVIEGRISEARINASVRRILSAKERFGVLDWQPLDPATAPERMASENNGALVNTLFEKGITLVYDNAGLLPVAENTLFIYPSTRSSLWEVCNALGVGLRPLGVSFNPTDEEVAWARTSAQTASKVVVFTQNAVNSPAQRALISALPPEKTLVVALESVYDIETLPAVGAYLVTYSPMRASNNALCQILTGEKPPLGVFSIGLGR